MKGHANHLENCLGRTKSSHSLREYTLTELVQLEVQKIETEERKLQELEMGGLIDVNDEQATFMVVGSTGMRSKTQLHHGFVLVGQLCPLYRESVGFLREALFVENSWNGGLIPPGCA